MKLLTLFGFILIISTCFVSQAAQTESDSVPRILVLGDSLSAGYGLSADQAFPEQLLKALRGAGYRVTVINAGVSGDTTAGGLSRLAWALADQPDIVILELGANDALRGLAPEQTKDNLDQIITRLIQSEADVLLTGMLAPRNLGQEYYSKFDRLYAELAEKHGIPLYPFFLEGVAGEPRLNLDDGIHPNAEGVGVIVEGIIPFVENLLKKHSR